MTLILQLFFLILYLIAVTNSQDSDNVDNDGLRILGTAIQLYNPCEDGILSMIRESGRPPSKDNYWEGTVDLTEFKKYDQAKIVLKLDSEATISLDPKIGKISSRISTFCISTFGMPSSLKFIVEAPPNKPFPNLKSICINGMKKCVKMREKWQPEISGSTGIALGVISQTDFKPFCGRKQLEHSKLIVRGRPTERGDWPWHAAIFLYNITADTQTYRCGGTLISSVAVVTAAHCATRGDEPISNDLLIVELGKHILNASEDESIRRQVASVNIPDDYESNFLRNDIAVIRLKENVMFNQFIQPACLWPENDLLKYNIFGINGSVVGWGVDENDMVLQKLNAVDMPVASDVECLLSFSSFYQKYITNTTFCAGNRNGASVCNGDSGGGLVIGRLEPDNKISWYLRGIVSISVRRLDKNACDPNHFVIFTDTARYLNFINQHRYEIL